MNPFLELRRLLQARAPSRTGTVIALTDTTLTVRTAQGVVQAQRTDATSYQVGDEVMVKDGIVQGRVTPAASVPTYYV